MPRKRTPDQPTTETETTTSTAVAEPEPDQNSEQTLSFVERVGERNNRNTTPDPFNIASDIAAGVRLFENRQDRLMVIKFDEKPIRDVIEKMKDSGFRWNPRDKVWVHPIRSESARTTRIEAERLYQEVRQMIRQDKGIEADREIPF